MRLHLALIAVAFLAMTACSKAAHQARANAGITSPPAANASASSEQADSSSSETGSQKVLDAGIADDLQEMDDEANGRTSRPAEQTASNTGQDSSVRSAIDSIPDPTGWHDSSAPHSGEAAPKQSLTGEAGAALARVEADIASAARTKGNAVFLTPKLQAAGGGALLMQSLNCTAGGQPSSGFIADCRDGKVQGASAWAEIEPAAIDAQSIKINRPTDPSVYGPGVAFKCKSGLFCVHEQSTGRYFRGAMLYCGDDTGCARTQKDFAALVSAIAKAHPGVGNMNTNH